jgi:hypothetical protein
MAGARYVMARTQQPAHGLGERSQQAGLFLTGKRWREQKALSLTCASSRRCANTVGPCG